MEIRWIAIGVQNVKVRIKEKAELDENDEKLDQFQMKWDLAIQMNGRRQSNDSAEGRSKLIGDVNSSISDLSPESGGFSRLL
jgi:hypothetical protein